ncbi:DNA invertase Pin-like site-specific DNA recombinase [Bacillus sp. SLBN-46]|uniref:hypothetical protein n=1 Tax=Bacillus sp. SLBN-46 TaxID=3042283 RepID=UPI0028646C48|nr:hypothetical protein [Bacillus sp. SLBN-46]MDR6124048.1 DNA invertase Pin-like site-specific DNA recombinase [Bacillus sp. SLBN-46]
MLILNREYKDDNEWDKGINELIRNLVFKVISCTDEEQRKRIKQAQREGIISTKKRGKHLGRPKKDFHSLSDEQKMLLVYKYKDWKERKDYCNVIHA